MLVKFKTKDNRELVLSLLYDDQSREYHLLDNAANEYLSFKEDEETGYVFSKNDLLNESEDSLFEKINLLLKQNSDDDLLGIEDDDSNEHNSDPFNPDDVSIETRTVTMETLLRRLEQKTILLNPDFQRKEVWSIERKSQLIESLLLRIPLPMFYVSSDEKSNWTVVDGLQRISTFRDYVLGSKYISDPTKYRKYKGEGFSLSDLEFWSDLNGKQMNDLPVNLYNRILETNFTFTIINPGTHEEVKRNIFKRLNTGGLPLSSQEIRNALYTGLSTELLNELATTKEFLAATCRSIQAQRMEDRELVLRYVAFILRDFSTYKRTQNIDTWLSDTMIILNSMPSLDSREINKCIKRGTVNAVDINRLTLDDIKNSFTIAMKRAKTIFGAHAFRKSVPGMRRRPVNKSLFETWGVILSSLSDSEFINLTKNRAQLIREYTQILGREDFVIAISRDSMKHASVSLRFNLLKSLVQKYK